MSEVSQPKLIETIEKALEAATPGPWKAEKYGVIAQKDGEYSEELAEMFDMSSAPGSLAGNIHLIANAPVWFRALLDENSGNQQLLGMQKEVIGRLGEELQQTREELEHVKSEVRSLPTQDAYDAACKALWKHRADNESLRTELSAKDKVLEWYGCDWAYLRHYVKHGDGENIISDSEVQQDKGTKARSILSQYGDTHD